MVVRPAKAMNILGPIRKSSMGVLSVFDVLSGSDLSIRIAEYYRGIHNRSYHIDLNAIAFSHVPKTGGTSLVHHFKELRESGLPLSPTFTDHHPVSRFCDPSTFRYVSCHREPVERVWSYYQMALRSDPDNPYSFIARSFSLEGFLRKCWQVRNLMCKYVLSDYRDSVTAADAYSSLSNFYFVYDFRCMDSSHRSFLSLVSSDYNLDIGSHDNWHLPSCRISSYPPPLPDQVELIKAYNAQDVALYKRWLDSLD